MSDPRDSGRYEAPIERLAGGRTGLRRARIAAIVVAAVVASAIGLAILPGASTERLLTAPTIPTSRPLAPGPSGRPTSSRVEALLDLPDRAIRGAPQTVLVERRGDDARLVGWTPGQGLATISTISGAFSGLATSTLFPVRSPGSRRLLVLSGTGAGASGGDHGRLVDASGTVLWEGDGLTALSGAVWSRDSLTVVAAAQGGTWRILSVRGMTATSRLVRLPRPVGAGAGTSTPAPGSADLVPRTVPLGFSADGRWIYGAYISPQLATLTTGFRVSASGNRAETVTTFGVGRPEGLLPEPGTLGGRIIDPVAGRIADWRSNTDLTGGPPTIEVRKPDGGFAFTLGTGTPLGSAWDANGGLYVLTADAILFPNRTTLVRVDGDGSIGPPLLETGPVGGVALLGVADGFAALAVTVGRPTSAAQLVLVDLADSSQVAAIRLPADDTSALVAADLMR